MKFTVVIPCYNCSKTIEQALESLVKQTFKDFEVILIDDASLDFDLTISVINLYKSKLHINLIRNACNMNGAYSRNKGIEAATGDFIAFLDSDDTWVPDRLESAIKILKSSPDTKKLLIYGQFELIRNHSTGAILPIRGIRKFELVSEYVFAASQYMQTSTFICSSDLAKNVMFDSKLSRHQDSDFAMRAQHVGALIYFQKRKCASYIFKSDELRLRIASGRINENFCINWLKEKEIYFSRSAIAGYNLTTFSRILFIEGRFYKSLKMIYISLKDIHMKNLADIVKTKFITLYKTRLGI